MAGVRRPTNRPNPRPNNSPGGMPGMGVPSTGPHMEFGQKGQDTGHSNRQLPNVDPGFNVQAPRVPNGPSNMKTPNRGSAGWLAKHPNGPMARNQTQPGGMPQAPGFDYNAFNAWQDPNISGTQPGAIQQGWGGVGSLDSMTQTKMNDYLNQQATGGARETMMNQLGFYNGGIPYKPQGLGPAGGGDYSDYTSPGVYQQMNAANTGYEGVSNVNPDGTGGYTSFAGARRPRRGGTTGGYLQ